MTSEVKITTTDQVKSYTGNEMLKKAFSETLSVELTDQAIVINSDLTDLDASFEHSSVDLELTLQYHDN